MHIAYVCPRKIFMSGKLSETEERPLDSIKQIHRFDHECGPSLKTSERYKVGSDRL
jgi:hypothetical protein